MKVLIINTAEPGNTAFVSPLEKLCKRLQLPFVIRLWREFIRTTETGSWHAILISASPMGNNANFEERLEAFQWLKKTDNRVFGICAGHQLLGAVFGSRLIQLSESEVGAHKVRLKADDPVFSKVACEIEVIQQHHDSITLPDGFLLLATSDRCSVQAMRHAEKPLYSVQWHAEISSPDIIERFLNP